MLLIARNVSDGDDWSLLEVACLIIMMLSPPIIRYYFKLSFRNDLIYYNIVINITSV